MILSSDVINREVSVTGRELLHSLGHGFIGSGMICEVFQAELTVMYIEVLKDVDQLTH